MQSNSSATKRRLIRLPVLISYAYSHLPYNNLVLENDDFETIVDSGAFTAFNKGVDITLKDYMEFLSKWGNKVFGYFNLDVIQDPVGTAKNLETLIANGYSPIPVHVLGDDEERMDQLFALATWVGLGGLRRPHRGPCPSSYLQAKMDWAKGGRVHWFGYARMDKIKQFRPYSCDTSSWAGAALSGDIYLYMGNGNMMVFNRNKFNRILHKNDEAWNVIESFGYNPVQFKFDEAWTGDKKKNGTNAHILLSVRCWVKMVYDVMRKLGTKIYLVNLQNYSGYSFLMDALEFAKKEGWCYE